MFLQLLLSLSLVLHVAQAQSSTNATVSIDKLENCPTNTKVAIIQLDGFQHIQILYEPLRNVNSTQQQQTVLCKANLRLTLSCPGQFTIDSLKYDIQDYKSGGIYQAYSITTLDGRRLVAKTLQQPAIGQNNYNSTVEFHNKEWSNCANVSYHSNYLF